MVFSGPLRPDDTDTSLVDMALSIVTMPAEVFWSMYNIATRMRLRIERLERRKRERLRRRYHKERERIMIIGSNASDSDLEYMSTNDEYVNFINFEKYEILKRTVQQMLYMASCALQNPLTWYKSSLTGVTFPPLNSHNDSYDVVNDLAYRTNCERSAPIYRKTFSLLRGYGMTSLRRLIATFETLIGFNLISVDEIKIDEDGSVTKIDSFVELRDTNSLSPTSAIARRVSPESIGRKKDFTNISNEFEKERKIENPNVRVNEFERKLIEALQREIDRSCDMNLSVSEQSPLHLSGSCTGLLLGYEVCEYQNCDRLSKSSKKNKHSRGRRLRRKMHHKIDTRPFRATVYVDGDFEKENCTNSCQIDKKKHDLLERSQGSEKSSENMLGELTPQSFPQSPAHRSFVISTNDNKTDGRLAAASDRLKFVLNDSLDTL